MAVITHDTGSLEAQEVAPIEILPPELPNFTLEEAHEHVFAYETTVYAGEGEVNTTRFVPDEVEDEVPVVIVPGYAGIESAYTELGYAMAYGGKRVAYTMTPVRRHGAAALHPNHFLHPLRLPSQAVNAVAKTEMYLHGDVGVDLFCHSLGGPTGIGAALHRPEYFRLINLAGSAGLTGHNALDLARSVPGAAVDVGRNILKLPIDRRRAARHLLHYLFDNVPRTVLEAVAISGTDINDDVQRVRDIGIKVVRTQFIRDPFFPTSKVSDEDKTVVDAYLEVDDGHLGPLLQPVVMSRLHHQAAQSLDLAV